jgi:predicted phosphate transport protein (TIGR00153 family)
MAWLAERLDRIADTAEGAMRAILLRKHLMKALKKAERKDERIKKWRSNLLKMAKLTTETINVLQSSVEALKTDTDLALRRAKDVDALEHQVDLIEEELIDDLYELEHLLDPLSVVQLVDVIRRSGNISDRAEDMSDSIAILAMSFVA